MAKVCRHAYISGEVQGVFYRQTAKEQALDRQIGGWVKNLPDGRVEIMICGEEEALETMIHWLHQGPSRATVENVLLSDAPFENYATFDILR